MAIKNLFHQLTFLLLILMFILWGCTKEPKISLPFETIDKADTSGTGNNYQGNEPKLEILTDRNGIASASEYVSLETQTTLDGLDYSKYIVIAVFQGYQPSLGYGVEVQDITQDGSLVVIYAHFTEPESDSIVAAMETSPYHLVKLSREGLQGDFQFVLNVDGKVEIRQEQAVP